MGTSKTKDEIWREWRDLVNMSPAEIEHWLDTKESKSVGDTGNAASTGRQSGKRIIDIKHTTKSKLSDAQWEHMAKVTGYIKRHCAQGGPAENIAQSKWRYALMNWGHDPLKDDGCGTAA